MNKKLLLPIIIIPSLAAVGLLLIPPYLEWEYKAQSLTDEKWRESFNKIRDSCLSPDWMVKIDVLHNAYNSTHVIDNNTCEWNKMIASELRSYQILTCPDYFPPSPHKDAIWNGEKCWWYLVDPTIPFELLTFEHSFSTNDDSLGNWEEWCDDNNGLWFPRTDSCKYLTDEAGEKAKADLDDRKNTPVGGKKALAICQTVDIPCPENPEFKGHYSLSSGKTFVNQYKSGDRYTFYFNENDMELFYKICIEKDDECTEYKKIGDDTSFSSVYQVTGIIEPIFDNQSTIVIFDIPYTIKGGIVDAMDQDYEANSLLVRIDSSSDGFLTVEVPYQILDYGDQKSCDIFTLVNQEEVAHEMSFSRIGNKIVTLNFTHNNPLIEIIGVTYPC